MPGPRRAILLSALALVVPMSAVALPGEIDGTADAAVADLGVSASLDSCGLLETQIVCTFSVSYSTLPNATSYTASVTSPDGSVTDFGSVPAGGTSLTVPYAGNGTYGVRVTAYGVPEDEPDAEEQVIGTDVTENVTEDTAGEPRVSEGPVESEAEPRDTPAAEEPIEQAPEETPEAPVEVEPEPVCEPVPAPAPEPAAPEVDTTAAPEDGAAVEEPQAGRETVEPETAEAEATPAPPVAPAAPECPAP
jgi:hypothetical protein